MVKVQWVLFKVRFLTQCVCCSPEAHSEGALHDQWTCTVARYTLYIGQRSFSSWPYRPNSAFHCEVNKGVSSSVRLCSAEVEALWLPQPIQHVTSYLLVGWGYAQFLDGFDMSLIFGAAAPVNCGRCW